MVAASERFLGNFMSLRTCLNQSALRTRSGALSASLAFGVLSLAFSACSVVGGDQTGAGLGSEKEQPGSEEPGSTQPGSGASTSAPSGVGSGESSPEAEGSSTQESEPGSPSSDEESSSTPESTETPDESAHLQYMVVTPGNQMVEMDLKATRELVFSARGYYSDGKSKNMGNEVTWSVVSSELGSFADNKLTLSAHNELFVKSSIIKATTAGGIEARAQLTVAAFEKDGPKKDFVFVLPYNGKAGPITKFLEFKTDVQALDLFFSVDTTGSMGDEIGQLRNSLQTTIVPELQKDIPNTQFGVGAVEDFPVEGFGRPEDTAMGRRADQPFSLKQTITADIGQVQSAIGRLSLGRGADSAESILEGLYQVATGKGLTGPGPTSVASNNSGVGGVGFRKSTMPVIVSITDAASHAPGETGDSCGRDYSPAVKAVAATREQTEQALEDICARVITVASAGNHNPAPECSPRIDGKRLADATEARVSPLVWNGKRPSGCAVGQCCTGLSGAGVAPGADGLCDLVFDVDAKGTGLDKSIVTGVQALAFFAPFDVITEKEGKKTSVSGKPMPAGTSSLTFLKVIQAHGFGALPLPGLPEPVKAGSTFKKVTPGTQITFSIQSYNDFIEPTSKAQVFQAKIGVKADQCEGLELDDREVVFVVPPKPLVAG